MGKKLLARTATNVSTRVDIVYARHLFESYPQSCSSSRRFICGNSRSSGRIRSLLRHSGGSSCKNWFPNGRSSSYMYVHEFLIEPRPRTFDTGKTDSQRSCLLQMSRFLPFQALLSPLSTQSPRTRHGSNPLLLRLQVPYRWCLASGASSRVYCSSGVTAR